MAPKSTILSLHGRGLKLDTRADIEPYLTGYDPAAIEEVHFGGNTIGVEAAEALAEFLQKTEVLKVCQVAFSYHVAAETHLVISNRTGCRLRRHLHRSPDHRDPSGPFRDM